VVYENPTTLINMGTATAKASTVSGYTAAATALVGNTALASAIGRGLNGLSWWSDGGGPVTHLRLRVALVCDNCGKRFTLMPADARALMKNKHVFHSFACRTEWLRNQRVKG